MGFLTTAASRHECAAASDFTGSRWNVDRTQQGGAPHQLAPALSHRGHPRVRWGRLLGYAVGRCRAHARDTCWHAAPACATRARAGARAPADCCTPRPRSFRLCAMASLMSARPRCMRGSRRWVDSFSTHQTPDVLVPFRASEDQFLATPRRASARSCRHERSPGGITPLLARALARVASPAAHAQPRAPRPRPRCSLPAANGQRTSFSALEEASAAHGVLCRVVGLFKNPPMATHTTTNIT